MSIFRLTLAHSVIYGLYNTIFLQLKNYGRPYIRTSDSKSALKNELIKLFSLKYFVEHSSLFNIFTSCDKISFQYILC